MVRRPQFERLEPRAMLDAASIAGSVLVTDAAGMLPVGGVTIELVDESGSVLESAETNAAGNYRFDNLVPGMYGVQQVQPNHLASLTSRTGTAGGSRLHPNLMIDIRVAPGDALTGYHFIEQPLPANSQTGGDRPVFTTGVLPMPLAPPTVAPTSAQVVVRPNSSVERPNFPLPGTSSLLVFTATESADVMLGDDSGGSGQVHDETEPTRRSRRSVPAVDPLDEIWKSLESHERWDELVDGSAEPNEEEALALASDEANRHSRDQAFEEIEREAAAVEGPPTEQPPPQPTRLADRTGS